MRRASKDPEIQPANRILGPINGSSLVTRVCPTFMIKNQPARQIASDITQHTTRFPRH